MVRRARMEAADVSTPPRTQLQKIVYAHKPVTLLHVITIGPPFSTFFAEACVRVHGDATWETAFGFCLSEDRHGNPFAGLHTVVKHKSTGAYYDLCSNVLGRTKKWFLPLDVTFRRLWERSCASYERQVWHLKLEKTFREKCHSLRILYRDDKTLLKKTLVVAEVLYRKQRLVPLPAFLVPGGCLRFREKSLPEVLALTVGQFNELFGPREESQAGFVSYQLKDVSADTEDEADTEKMRQMRCT